MSSDLPFVIGITGASGAAYALRTLEVLLASGQTVHVVMSPAAAQVFQAELGVSIDPFHPDFRGFIRSGAESLHVWDHRNLAAGIASGSFKTAGMVIVPCSMSTLAAIAHGQSMNLIHRAADVHLKERRKLVLVPRETPLSLIAIENMAGVTRAGGIVLPAMPGFYHSPKSIEDLVDFVVARICDQLGIDNDLVRRWGKQ